MKIQVALSGLALVHVLAVLSAAGPAGQSPPATQARFDMRVRADFFAGMRGDAAAFARAMDACEKTLAAEPKHPEALVWHGSGLLFQAGQAYRAGDAAKGGALWDRGMREMDDAVALAPTSVNVLIPRGATLLQVSRFVPAELVKGLLAKGLEDYEKAYAVQKPFFGKLSAHARGELLFGLAEGWARLGEPSKARRYFELIVSEAEGSGQEPRARAWLETGRPPADTSCIGCH